MSTAPGEQKAVKPHVFHVKPVIGEEDKRWDLHRVRTAKHEHFRTVQEAVAAAHEEAGTHSAHIVIHAFDGHAYREYDLH
ncbi:DUF2188 domain-containing protein [Arthrobacter cavernae]|uniref:DUF2188 domain-containing protein n=1 Tax=Arthrobacter cavernae TaxID=2817681 RepID=A0A939KQC5_9MICC|nr:DUF2188 domain-containing protein [Arthrobacter cavernae]MBO1269970.1 DUF2188 domain-containing protein [Arthrobacter cavernae]